MNAASMRKLASAAQPLVKTLDEQAAIEGSLSCFFSALTGGDLCHDVGYTESAMTGSVFQLAMMGLAIGSAVMMLYAGYLFVLNPLARLQRGLTAVQQGDLVGRADDRHVSTAGVCVPLLVQAEAVQREGKALLDQEGASYDVIVKLDADTSFDADIAEAILGRMERDNLGIAAGTPFIMEGGKVNMFWPKVVGQSGTASAAPVLSRRRRLSPEPDIVFYQ